MEAKIGDVIEFDQGVSTLGFYESGLVAVLVEEVFQMIDGSEAYRGVLLDCAVKSRYDAIQLLANEENLLTLHPCELEPCPLIEADTVIHFAEGYRSRGEGFVADYVGSHGRQTLQLELGKLRKKGLLPKAKEAPGASKKPGGTATPKLKANPKEAAKDNTDTRGKRRAKDGDRDGKEMPGEERKTAAKAAGLSAKEKDELRVLLANARRNAGIGAGKRKQEVVDVEDLPGAFERSTGSVRAEGMVAPSGSDDEESPAIGGYKRWWFETFEREEEEGGQEGCEFPAAGSSRAAERTKGRGQEGEEEERSRWKERKEKEKEEEEEKEGEEKEEGETGKRRRSLWIWRRWFRRRSNFLFLLRFRRRRRWKREQRGLGFELRSTLEEDGVEEPWQCAEETRAALPGTAGSRSSIGGYRKTRRSDVRDKDSHVLRLAGEAILRGHSSHGSGVASALTDVGPAESGEAGWSRGCDGISIHSSAHSTSRRKLECGIDSGNVSTSSYKCGPGFDHATSSQASEVVMEESGVPRRKRRKLGRLAERKPERESAAGGQRQRKAEREEQRERKRKLASALESMEQLSEQPEPWRRKRKQLEREQGGEAEGGSNLKDEPEKVMIWHRANTSGAIFEWLVSQSSSLHGIGCAMAWSLFNCQLEVEEAMEDTTNGFIWGLCYAMHRDLKKKSSGLFPIPSLMDERLEGVFQGKSLEAVTEDAFAQIFAEDAWLKVALYGLNRMAGETRAKIALTPNAVQREAIETVRDRVRRVLANDHKCPRSLRQVEAELAERFLSYTGEEIPKMEVLTLEQCLPALPPQTHGGCIEALNLVSDNSRVLLAQPHLCVASDTGQDLPRLQAKVHIKAGEEGSLAEELISRGICCWTRKSEVFCFRNQPVLNGMFGVRKSAVTETGKPVLRLIMNLIPTNACMVQLRGSVKDLPSICQWLSITLGPNEELRFAQSDMSSAFYLFRLPMAWSKYICSNIVRRGRDIGKDDDEEYYLSCRVVPMGWASAVGPTHMQEMADSLARLGDLPDFSKIVRSRPIPDFLVRVIKEARSKRRSWFHVYLDNLIFVQARNLTTGMKMHQKAINFIWLWKTPGLNRVYCPPKRRGSATLTASMNLELLSVGSKSILGLEGRDWWSWSRLHYL